MKKWHAIGNIRMIQFDVKLLEIKLDMIIIILGNLKESRRVKAISF
jgi:hypothetical protein